MTTVHRNFYSNLSIFEAGEEQGTAFDGKVYVAHPPSFLLGDDNSTSYFKCNYTPNSTDQHKVDKSDFDDYKLAILIWQVCPPILFFFGTIGNVLILIMVDHLRLARSSMHIYLRVLAITDLVVIYTGLLRWWILETFVVDLRLIHVSICKIHLWLVQVSLPVSAWVLVLMTLERTFSLCFPHRVNMFSSKHTAWVNITLVIILNGCVYSHYLFRITIYNTNGTLQCHAPDTDTSYNNFLENIWVYVDLCNRSGLPSICLIICNIIIVYKTYISLKNAEILNLSSRTNSLRRRNASLMTAILLVLSAFFLLTTLPNCLFNGWYAAQDETKKTPQDEANSDLWWATLNLLLYCNHSFNFYLYCLTGSKFRREMKRQLSRNISSRTESRSKMFSAAPTYRFNNMCLRDNPSLTTPTLRMHDNNDYYL